MGARTHTAPSFRFAEMELDHRRAPLFGEHEDEVFGGLLGMAPAEIERLRSEGVAG